MVVTKLNGNYAGYPKWKFALEFPKNKAGKLERFQYVRLFIQLYGEDRTPSKTPTKYYDWNQHWYNDVKRNRINFNNESDITAIRLLM